MRDRSSHAERRRVFRGYEVGIGFSGTYADEGEATAFVGKRRDRFKAVLRKLAEIEG